MSRQWRAVVALVLALAFGAVLRAQAQPKACDCGRVVAPCAGYWTAVAVFAGRVESVARAGGYRVVTFAVLDGFRGVRSSTVEALTGPAGQRCSIPFRVGHEYMVYASRPAGSASLTVDRCSRTREIDDAASDLAYLRTLKDPVGAAGRISGQILLVRRGLNGKLTQSPQPLPDIGVRVVKDGAAETTVSNPAGDFSVGSRGAGHYSVEVDVPARYYTDDTRTGIELADARACAEVDVVLSNNGRVAGRVVSDGGLPVAGLTIELATANLTERRRTITDRDGRYALNRIPPGRFVVRAGTPVSALRVVVGAGASLTLDDLRLAPAAHYVPLSGFVLNADGAPAEGARVYLKGASEEARILSEPATVDFLGRFVIAGLANTDYRLFAERTRDRRVDSSDQVSVRAAAGLKTLKLVLRRRY
jgi:Carboxypeptidase regulatory-like domain